MLGWLIRFEAFPEYFTRVVSGYHSILNRDTMIEDKWMKLLFKGHPIGYSMNSLEVAEGDPKRYYTIKNQVFIKFQAMGYDQPVYVDTESNIDVMYTLRRFRFSLNSGTYRMWLEGNRIDEKKFLVKMFTGASTQRSVVEIPDDVILYSPMTEMRLRRMKPGQELTLKTLDPMSLNPTRMTVRAIRKEIIDHDGQDVEATLLETEHQGMPVESWMASDGTVLRQETPFGWTIVSCTPEEAIETIREEGFSGDILAAMAIRCTGKIEEPRKTKGLRLRLSGVSVPHESLSTPRQRVKQVNENGIELLVSAARQPETINNTEINTNTNLAAYLAATRFIQSDHPDLKKKASQIVKGIDDNREKVFAICDWVDKQVKNVMTISLPSALDVLHQREGDCNEHTYLFTGLARSIGIPTKIMVGVAFHEGKFFYHAWPSVYLGEWHEMDPTWGEKAVDATHIRLAEGELANQMELLRFLGQAEIEILEVL